VRRRASGALTHVKLHHPVEAVAVLGGLVHHAQPPRNLHSNDHNEVITHWVSASMPWDTPDLTGPPT
jgi:hypothetical protein